MSDYTTKGPGLQEAICGDKNKKLQKPTRDHMRERPLEPVTDGLYQDTGTGEAFPALDDPKDRDWRRKKQKTFPVADLYREGQNDKYADRVLSCATWMQFFSDLVGDKRTLQAFNACHLRLCPLCANRRARQMTARLVRILKAVKAEHPTAALLFLTLTVRNCEGDALRDTLTLLTQAWHRLAMRRPFMRAVRGWFRAIEITRNKTDGTYHPHIHAILVVEPDYFRKGKGLYILHSRDDKTPDGYKGPFWVDMWGECLGVSYKPSVRISRAKGKSGEQRNTDAASLAAALEAAKYATKDTEYITGSIPAAERVQVLLTYTDALRGKRLVALGGWMADAADGVDLEDDGDLVHGDEDGGEDLTAATAEMLEIYGWHFGVQDHVLQSRIPNPDYQGGPGNAS